MQTEILPKTTHRTGGFQSFARSNPSIIVRLPICERPLPYPQGQEILSNPIRINNLHSLSLVELRFPRYIRTTGMLPGGHWRPHSLASHSSCSKFMHSADDVDALLKARAEI